MATAKTTDETEVEECAGGEGCTGVCTGGYAGPGPDYYHRQTAMDFAIRLVESVNGGATEMTQRWVPDDPSELAGKILAFLKGE